MTNPKNLNHRKLLEGEALRPFSKENPDWRREYFLVAGMLVEIMSACRGVISHEMTHLETEPDKLCPASVLGFAMLTGTCMDADRVLRRLGVEEFNKHSNELFEVIKAELEADASAKQS